jgi:hypothetical protein
MVVSLVRFAVLPNELADRIVNSELPTEDRINFHLATKDLQQIGPLCPTVNVTKYLCPQYPLVRYKWDPPYPSRIPPFDANALLYRVEATLDVNSWEESFLQMRGVRDIMEEIHSGYRGRHAGVHVLLRSNRVAGQATPWWFRIRNPSFKNEL